jgi:hypothetical protein
VPLGTRPSRKKTKKKSGKKSLSASKHIRL